MNRILKPAVVLIAAILFSAACSGGKAPAADPAESFTPREGFSADSAFSYVVAQVAFGPRVPGTPAHDACAAWLVDRLNAFGADTVFYVGLEAQAWDGTVVPVRNILARFGSESPERILLMAHYDTRPWADHDPDPNARTQPIDGANDGASGVGVLLEIARNIGLERPDVGIDVLFTDLEDYGAPEGASDQSEVTWCIGSQQFARNLPYDAASMPRWGILLDMVGGRDARFPREYFSLQAAPLPTAKVWEMAGRLGLRERFPMKVGGAITDDHLPVSAAGIPVTDIIESANPSTGSFSLTWHTLADNIDNIDARTLGDVGRVVLNVIYNEKPL